MRAKCNGNEYNIMKIYKITGSGGHNYQIGIYKVPSS